MQEDKLMLTPAKIKNHHFEAAGRNAYKADSVDSFFEEVAASYEQMFRENGEMYKKISLLAERLEEYRNDEDNIRNALLTAQRMSEQIQREAREKADTLVSEAQARAVAENARVDAETNEMMAQANYQAQAIVSEAKKQAEKIIYDATHESKEAAISARDWMIKEEAALEMMRVEVTKFKKQILDSYNDQLALIEKLPEIVYAQVDAENEEEEAQVEEPAVEEESVAEEFVAVPVAESVNEGTVSDDVFPQVNEEETVNVDDTLMNPLSYETLDETAQHVKDALNMAKMNVGKDQFNTRLDILNKIKSEDLYKEDELKDALDRMQITKIEFENAYKEAYQSMDRLQSKKQELQDFTDKYLKQAECP